jgi:hypothetical protein
MLLIEVLFYLDTYYETLLNGAVERALDLETAIHHDVKVTEYLSANAVRSKSIYATGAVYVGLLIVTGSVGLFVAGTGGQVLILLLLIILAFLVLAYWIFAQRRTGGFSTKDRSKGLPEISPEPKA